MLEHIVTEGIRSIDLPGAGQKGLLSQSGTPFSGMINSAVADLELLRIDANEKTRRLMVGDGVDIHTVLIATQKADSAFELALAVRNKAVNAYQQLMNMQF